MSPPARAPSRNLIHEFGDFELDTMRRMLTRRADGQPVDITGRVFDALTYLVVRPGQLVERRVLMDALWPNVVVEDGNLSQTIHTLRRVLGEKAGEHRYIVTVPGRGYQFVAEVKMRAAVGAPTAQPVQPAASAPPSRRPKWILVAGAMALLVVGVVGALTWRGREQPAARVAASAQPSIAVLPFDDMSEEQNQAHFAEGLSEKILDLLANANTLRVTARTSS